MRSIMVLNWKGDSSKSMASTNLSCRGLDQWEWIIKWFGTKTSQPEN
ncbi:MAG: hypothetical protein ACI9V8_001536 [Urechidicola sp.]|jgi:hypothetical protein